jgi:hypothetical protein
MYTDEKPSQIHADDYPCARGLHRDTPPMQSTPQRSAQQYSRTEGAAG